MHIYEYLDTSELHRQYIRIPTWDALNPKLSSNLKKNGPFNNLKNFGPFKHIDDTFKTVRATISGKIHALRNVATPHVRVRESGKKE